MTKTEIISKQLNAINSSMDLYKHTADLGQVVMDKLRPIFMGKNRSPGDRKNTGSVQAFLFKPSYNKHRNT